MSTFPLVPMFHSVSLFCSLKATCSNLIISIALVIHSFWVGVFKTIQLFFCVTIHSDKKIFLFFEDTTLKLCKSPSIHDCGVSGMTILMWLLALLYKTKDLQFYCSPTTDGADFLQQHHILYIYCHPLCPFCMAVTGCNIIYLVF